MTGLAVLGGLGIAYALTLGFGAAVYGGFEPLFVILGVLMVLTLFSAVWVAYRQPSERMGSNIGRIALDVLAFVGVGILLVIACLIFLFVICLSGGRF